MLPPLILLHGALGHPDQFQELETLLHPYFDIHTLCFSGHGPQALTAAGIGITHLLAQVEQYIAKKGLEQVHFFGYSLGGYVALLYALQQPARVKSVLTLATKMTWSETIADQERQMLQPDLIMKKVPVYARQLERWHGEEKWKELMAATGNMMLQLGQNPPLNASKLAAIKVPVQMMVGDQDKMVSITETLEAARYIPGARLAVLPSSKHPFEQIRLSLLHSLMQDFWENK